MPLDMLSNQDFFKLHMKTEWSYSYLIRKG
jgi:hypothetical protein